MAVLAPIRAQTMKYIQFIGVPTVLLWGHFVPPDTQIYSIYWLFGLPKWAGDIPANHEIYSIYWWIPWFSGHPNPRKRYRIFNLLAVPLALLALYPPRPQRIIQFIGQVCSIWVHCSPQNHGNYSIYWRFRPVSGALAGTPKTSEFIQFVG